MKNDNQPIMCVVLIFYNLKIYVSIIKSCDKQVLNYRIITIKYVIVHMLYNVIQCLKFIGRL